MSTESGKFWARQLELSKLSKEALEREEEIESLHEALAYHQSKIDEYEWKIRLLEGKVEAIEISKDTEKAPF